MKHLIASLSLILALVVSVSIATAQSSEDVKGGKQQAVGPLIGQVMKEIQGADPKQVRQMLIDAINA